MGKKSRTKGASYERQIARLFQLLGWTEAKRHLEYQGPEAAEGRDLDGTAPFAVQVKCWAKTPSISAIEEVTTTDDYAIPLAVLKRSSVGREPLEVVVMHLDTFMALLSAMQEHVPLTTVLTRTWELFDELSEHATDDAG